MKQTFKFTDNGIRIEVDVELKNSTKGGEALSICGSVYERNSRGRYIMTCGGQCLDEPEFQKAAEKSALLKRIIELWEKYHLNDLHAGTEKQEEYLDNYYKTNHLKSHDYTRDCEILKDVGLLVDDGYKYGTDWLFRAIPEKDLDDIRLIVQTDDKKELEKVFASR